MRYKSYFRAVFWMFSLSVWAQEESQLKDIKPVYDIPLSWEEVLIYALFGLLGAGLLAVVAYVIWRKMHRKPLLAPKPVEPPLSPHELALRQLDELKVATGLDDKAYYIRLTDIVREYLESRFGIKALEMTSEEILSALSLSVEVESLGELLRFADLVKFAKANSNANERQRAWFESRQFIFQTQPAEPQTAENNDVR